MNLAARPNLEALKRIEREVIALHGPSTLTPKLCAECRQHMPCTTIQVVMYAIYSNWNPAEWRYPA